MAEFTKSNPSQFADALYQEAAGLEHLREVIAQSASNIKIPQVYAVNKHTLSLEQINTMAGSKTQWQQFGHSLAKLHLQLQTQYGWHENNYIGLNPQNNLLTDDWGALFYEYRLGFQVKLIKERSIQNNFKHTLESCQNQLIAYLNQNCDFPSLLHGDLWSGNVLFDEQDVWLIDPAIYCGDAEADLAMTELFGGFPAAFYQAYAEVKPMTKQYPLKKIIYNLYHQLNHYNLFDSGYLAGCERGLETITQHFK